MIAKVWRATGLLIESEATDGFWWLPLGLGSEVLVASIFTIVIVGVARRRPRLGVGVAVALFGGFVFWLTLNDISYRISQIGITFWRMRGDEGVRFRDFELVSVADVVPALAFSATAVVVALLIVRWSRKWPASAMTWRRLSALTLIGAIGSSADILVFSDRNFGMAENPIVLLARTWLDAIGGPARVRLPRTVKTPTDRAGRLALLQPEEPQPENVTPTRASPAVKNGILFFSEGIARKHTGLEGETTTPNLLRAIKTYGALDFENYYSPYHKSIAAIYSMTCADVPPPNARNIMEINPRIDCGSLPEVMVENGVHAGLFHGGDFGFYDKLQLLGMRGFEIQKDARALAGNGAWEYDWGIDDRIVVDALLAWIDTIPREERFFAVLIPITAHYPYAIPPDVTPEFPGSNGKKRFYSAVHFLDEAYGRLIDGLVARGRLDDTAVLYMADHGETVAERPRAQAGRRLAYEPSLHIPFAIVAPSVFTSHQMNARVGSHVDLLPTIIDLMGLKADPRHFGQSLLSPDFSPRRVFIGASNGPKYVGFVDGRTKFIVGRSTGVRELYNLIDDPDETHNLADVDLEKTNRYASQALAFADAQISWLKSAPKLDDTIDVQVGLLDNAEVRVVRPDETVVSCTRPADSMGEGAVIDVTGFDALPWRRTCPGQEKTPVFLGARTTTIGRPRDCVLVNVPAGGGAVEIVLRNQPWQAFLTRIRATVDRGLVGEDDEAIITAFGDGRQGQERPISAEDNAVRVTYPSSTHELVVRISGTGPMAAPICLTFTEMAWKTRPARKTTHLTADPPDPATIRPTTLPEDDDDDGHPRQQPDEDTHGKRPRPGR